MGDWERGGSGRIERESMDWERGGIGIRGTGRVCRQRGIVCRWGECVDRESV